MSNFKVQVDGFVRYPATAEVAVVARTKRDAISKAMQMLLSDAALWTTYAGDDFSAPGSRNDIAVVRVVSTQ